MRRTQHLKIIVAFGLLAGAALCLMAGRRAEARQERPLTIAQAEQLFTEKIRPVLEAKCRTCHDSGGAMSDLDLSSRVALLQGGKRGASVIPGDAARSLLFIAITGADEKLVKRMPPGGKPLDDDVILAFRQWIDAGAPWPETDAASKKTWAYKEADVWAFRATQQVAPPALNGSPVDAFLLQKIKAKNLTPAPAADRVALLRRATFDLTGLPPAPEEVAAFVQDKDALPQAFAKVVERLLTSPRYGERWGRHWLDVVRYADTSGGANDYERPHAWRYRDYVIRAFNQDKPYDQFIREQIAGDELDANNAEHLIATGFLRMGPWEHTAMSVEAVTRQEWLDDVTHATGTAFLGLTMGCAKCHDHKFDPIPAKDYYRLQAVFATTSFADKAAPFLAQENLSEKAQAMARLAPKLDRALAKQTEVANALGIKLRTQAPNQAATPPAATPPSPAITPPAQQPPAVIKRYGEDARKAELREFERAYLKRVEFGKLALRRYEPITFSVGHGDPAKPSPPAETFVLIGGNLTSPGEKVAPGVPSAPCELAQQDAPPLPTQAAGRRLALARWMAGKDNPLTARVMVNRIWQWHFGKGLVETANNFGKLGARPTHPELLDWLAQRFVADGWSVKAMHRLLMNSDAYRRHAAHPQMETVKKADPENRLLTYFPARRLEAEELRDAMLMVSGELHQTVGGPPVFPEINADLIRQPRMIMGTIAPAWEPSPTRAERNRRTIYTFQQRSLINPLVEVFNGANPNESCEFRRASTVAPQVFNLFNSQFSHDAALAMARRIETATKGRAAQIALAFRLTMQREPTAAEQRLLLAHLAAMTAHHEKTAPPPLPALQPVEQLINSEFTGQTIRFVEDTDFNGYERNLHPSQVNAATRALAEVCLTLLNANEFVYVY